MYIYMCDIIIMRGSLIEVLVGRRRRREQSSPFVLLRPSSSGRINFLFIVFRLEYTVIKRPDGIRYSGCREINLHYVRYIPMYILFIRYFLFIIFVFVLIILFCETHTFMATFFSFFFFAISKSMSHIFDSYCLIINAIIVLWYPCPLSLSFTKLISIRCNQGI